MLLEESLSDPVDALEILLAGVVSEDGIELLQRDSLDLGHAPEHPDERDEAEACRKNRMSEVEKLEPGSHTHRRRRERFQSQSAE